MRKHEHRRDHRGVAKAGTPEARGAPVSPHQKVLRLQRLAGNAAMTALLTPDRVVPRDAGRPLDPVLRGEMEAKLGHDFSAVRLHEDADAARALGAHAYTVGTHIVFAPGRYEKYRLAHELVHVVQQEHGPVAGTEVAPGVTVSDPADHHERQAEALSQRAVAQVSQPAGGLAVSGGRSASVQRHGEGERPPLRQGTTPAAQVESHGAETVLELRRTSGIQATTGQEAHGVIQRQPAASKPSGLKVEALRPDEHQAPAWAGPTRLGKGAIEDIASTSELIDGIKRILHPAFRSRKSTALDTVYSFYSHDNVERNAHNMIDGGGLRCPLTAQDGRYDYRGDVIVKAKMSGKFEFLRLDKEAQMAKAQQSQSTASTSRTGSSTKGATSGSTGSAGPLQVSVGESVAEQQGLAVTSGLGGTTTRTTTLPRGRILFRTDLVYEITHKVDKSLRNDADVGMLGMLVEGIRELVSGKYRRKYTILVGGIHVSFPAAECRPL